MHHGADLRIFQQQEAGRHLVLPVEFALKDTRSYVVATFVGIILILAVLIL